MSWGGNNLVVVNNGVQNTPINPPKLQQASLQVPLCIAYVTSLKLVKEEANIL
jgi:hypothetical protein